MNQKLVSKLTALSKQEGHEGLIDIDSVATMLDLRDTTIRYLEQRVQELSVELAVKKAKV